MNSFEFSVPTKLQKVRILSDSERGGNPGPSGGYPEGFLAGYRAGQWKAEKEMQVMKKKQAAAVNAILKALEQANDKVLGMAEKHLPQLLLATVSRLFQKHYYTEEQFAEEVKILLKELAQAHRICVECHPTQLQGLSERLRELEVSLGQGRLEFKPNEALQLGEFMVMSDLGNVDGRRVAKVAQVEMAVADL